MRKYGESKATRIMMATVPHVTSGSGLKKFQADGTTECTYNNGAIIKQHVPLFSYLLTTFAKCATFD